VTLFLQNRYLVEKNGLAGLPFKLRMRLMVERFWLKSFKHHVANILVQTPSMQVLAQRELSRQVGLAPFVADARTFSRKSGVLSERVYKFDFVYVASGYPHKNHRNLVDAWRLLAEQGVFPSLCLTIDEKVFPELVSWINTMRASYGLKIENVSGVAGMDLYQNARTLVFPSILESFGLPLIEARNAGLAVVASELDYVRDLIDPEESFDPQSPVSIARAVKRFMKVEENDCALLAAQEFLQLILPK
jgi:glycosyltransferase involved in cell wall biosynthesis